MPSPTAPRGFVVRAQSAAAPPVASTVARPATNRLSVRTPRQRPSAVQRSTTRSPWTTEMPGWLRTRSERTFAMRRPVSAPPAWTTRGREWPPSRPSSMIELDAQVDEIGDPGRRLGGESGDSAWPTEAPPRFERVGSVLGRIVVLAQRGCDAALRQITGRRAQRPFRDQASPLPRGRHTGPRTALRRLRPRSRDRRGSLRAAVVADSRLRLPLC